MSVEALVAVAIGALTGVGVWLVMRRQTFPVILGLSLMSYAVNLFLFASGRLAVGAPPIVAKGVTAPADPLPQALVLTAIVISFGMTAVILMMALGARFEAGDDGADLDPDRDDPR
jgi:multicomponent K+:H+ antiporter subunit C